MKTIYKYPINPYDKIMLPKGAEILTVQTQNNKPVLWALVDPNEEPERRNIEIFGTGQIINYDRGTERKYIGTFQLDNGSLVFHLFERIK